MIREEEIIEINKKLENGVVVNKSSLSFATSAAEDTKDWIKQTALLTRAILIDHVFEDGNKRTAAVIIGAMIELHGLAYDPFKVDKMVVEVIMKNITDIKKIRRRIKDAIR